MNVGGSLWHYCKDSNRLEHVITFKRNLSVHCFMTLLMLYGTNQLRFSHLKKKKIYMSFHFLIKKYDAKDSSLKQNFVYL